jgi:hypothetical protein
MLLCLILCPALTRNILVLIPNTLALTLALTLDREAPEKEAVNREAVNREAPEREAGCRLTMEEFSPTPDSLTPEAEDFHPEAIQGSPTSEIGKDILSPEVNQGFHNYRMRLALESPRK